MKVIGHEYLKSVLKGIIDEIFHEKKNCEMDITRMDIVFFFSFFYFFHFSFLVFIYSLDKFFFLKKRENKILWKFKRKI